MAGNNLMEEAQETDSTVIIEQSSAAGEIMNPILLVFSFLVLLVGGFVLISSYS